MGETVGIRSENQVIPGWRLVEELDAYERPSCNDESWGWEGRANWTGEGIPSTRTGAESDKV